MRHKVVFSILAVWLLLFLASLSAAQAQDTTNTLMFDGRERTYHLHVPASYDADMPMSLIVALHPFASSGKAMQALTGLDDVADERGFITLYPDSAEFYWDDGRVSLGWQAWGEPVDDIDFVDAAINEVAETYNIDNIYLTGMDSGALLAQQMVCQFPGRFDGITMVGAFMWEFHATNCRASETPIDTLIIVNSDDELLINETRTITLPFTNNDVVLYGLVDTVLFWLEYNGCSVDALSRAADSAVLTYGECNDEARTSVYFVEGGGHNWLRTGDYTLNQFGLDTSQIVTSFLLGDENWRDTTVQTVTVDQVYSGMSRSFRYYVPPSYDPAIPTPVVVALHGRPDNGPGFATRLDMNRVAAEHNFIVVYPDGSNDRGWNYTEGTQYAFADNGIDEVAFLETLINDISHDLNIDHNRLYVTGFSNGGFMTQRVACSGADFFAAFAVVGAGLFVDFPAHCANTRPVPIMFIHGTQDVSIPWQGSFAPSGFPVSFPVPETIAFWATHNECTPPFTWEDVPSTGLSPETSVRLGTVEGCAQGTDIQVFAIQEGGHNVPGIVNRISPQIAGQVNLDIHGATEIWNFVSQYTLPS
ncbi:MAG: hypothetical protein D6737_10020 [Chloroflexi bacterium]|nr:MAG: hypothetical protein CUN54_02250 [Phototrophicales bacterium]RMF79893.1 MAG: hypothetical protein D6737_10020 [Chloroflexota bacterium]